MHRNAGSNRLYPFTPGSEHLRIGVHQTSFPPVCVFLSSSPDTQRSQRSKDTLELGGWLESNDTSKLWTEAQTTASQEEGMFVCKNHSTPVSSLFYPRSLAFSIHTGDLNHLVVFVPFPCNFNSSALEIRRKLWK